MGTGDGMQRIGLDEWGEATQYMEYEFYRDGTVVYESPYRGDYMSREEVARVLSLLPGAEHVRLAFGKRPEEPSRKQAGMEFHWVDRTPAGKGPAGPDADYIFFVIYYGDYLVWVHPIPDDYYIVDFRNESLFDFEVRPIYKCDQFPGVASAIRHVLES